MDGCEVHWCWVCRWMTTPGSIGIYDHLRKEHGGSYDFEQRNELNYGSDDYGSDEDGDY